MYFLNVSSLAGTNVHVRDAVYCSLRMGRWLNTRKGSQRNMKRKAHKTMDYSVIPKDYITTGSVMLDLAISCLKTDMGGLPTNRIVEFSGTGASGKTYICGEIAGNALRKGYSVYTDDIERRWDLHRLSTFGFDPYDPNFTYLDPPSKTVEECFERMFKHLDKVEEDKAVYIIDPIAALYSDKELTGSDKAGQARAKALWRNMRYLKDRVNIEGKSSLIVFSNQLIDDVGKALMGGKGRGRAPTKKTPMGNALVHFPSVRVRFKHRGKIKKKVPKLESELAVTRGVKLGAEIVKNSEDDPYREVEFTIWLGRYGIDNITDCSQWLKKYTKHLTGDDKDKDPAKWYYFNGEYSYTLRRFIEYVEENDLEQQLAELVSETYRKIYRAAPRKPKHRI
jgi:RecA/RadA recombinase